MSEPSRDLEYWADLRRHLEVFSESGKLEPYLSNTADFGELANVIFDDMDVEHRVRSLPDWLEEFRSFGINYFELLSYLIGDGPEITRDDPIFDPSERRTLFRETKILLSKIDKLLNAQ